MPPPPPGTLQGQKGKSCDLMPQARLGTAAAEATQREGQLHTEEGEREMGRPRRLETWGLCPESLGEAGPGDQEVFTEQVS